MIYSFDTRVSYSQVGPEGTIGIVDIMDYMQDCCMFHSQDMGVGVYDLHEINRMWVVIAWQVIVDRYPKAFERLTVSTMATEHDRLFCNRNFFITDEAGAVIAKANSMWSYLDMDKDHPVNLKSEPWAVEAFKPDAKLEMDYAPRKIDVPKEGGRELSPITITNSLIDANLHVNNVRFVSIAEQALGKKLYPKQLRAFYKNQAFRDEIITPVMFEDGERTVVRLKNEKDTCTDIEMFM